MEQEVTNNEHDSRFEVDLSGKLAFLDYRRNGDLLVLIHTEVPEENQGQGIGGKLAKAALEFARQNSLRVVPRCGFVVTYLKRHPEYQDLAVH